MLRLVIEVRPRDADALSGLLFDAGVAGLEQSDLPDTTRLIVYGDEVELVEIEATLGRAAEHGLSARFHREPVDDSWQTRWVEAAETHHLTDDLVMLPTGLPRPADAREVLCFEPGWAFGTGGHATTRLAAGCLRECLERHPGARVLDVGTGSGVLALAGILWGAASALGLDTDPRAVAVARRNAELNGFSQLARFVDTPLERVEERFSVVVANIDQPTLMLLCPQLCRATRDDGDLVLTGVLEDQSEELLSRFAERNLELREAREHEGWSLLRLRHALGKTRQS